jgi:MOSC domain-containing protein YiiM
MDAAHVVSVNLGRPAELAVGRRRMRSAIVKAPADGPVAIDAGGLAGDEQADRRHHGGPAKAAYAYAREDVDWWAAELGRALGPAAFGENLTLAGVDVSGARLGERWRIGSAELRVSGPRVPCLKLAARMGDTRFSKRFVAAGRPGAYLAVTVAGTVRAGDAVRVVHRPDHGVSVADVLHAALVDRARIADLAPARADMGPELLRWLKLA